MAKIRTNAQSLDFGALGFLKVCMAKSRTNAQSLDFRKFGILKVRMDKTSCERSKAGLWQIKKFWKFVWKTAARALKRLDFRKFGICAWIKYAKVSNISLLGLHPWVNASQTSFFVRSSIHEKHMYARFYRQKYCPDR